MTRRRDDLREVSYDRLMHVAGDRMDEGALRALADYQKIRDAGEKPKVLP
jgi:hypothetical protein